MARTATQIGAYLVQPRLASSTKVKILEYRYTVVKEMLHTIFLQSDIMAATFFV